MSTPLFINTSTHCGGCKKTDTMKLWPHPAKNPILLSVGHIRKIEIPVLCCTSCGTANYPDMTSFGVFPLHNRCLISIDYILELKDTLASGMRSYSGYCQLYYIDFYLSGASVIESIKNKISLLSLMHGLDKMDTNLTNLALSIEQCSIGNRNREYFICNKVRVLSQYC